MAAAIGNQYAARTRVWTQAINNVLDRRHPQGRMAALEDLAEKLIAQVEQGDLAAIREFGDRMEGKPGQSVNIEGELKLGLAQALAALPKVDGTSDS